MEPTPPGGILSDLTRQLLGPAGAAKPERRRLDATHRWRRIAIDLAIITATFITIVAYAIAVVAFAGWVIW
jgi:hypothetical protein